MINLLPFEVSLTSGSAPTRPTIVMRAMRLGVVVVNVRLKVDGRVVAARREGLSRKDMVVVLFGIMTDMMSLFILARCA